jgi:hypothetical protein
MSNSRKVFSTEAGTEIEIFTLKNLDQLTRDQLHKIENAVHVELLERDGLFDDWLGQGDVEL